MKYWEVVLGWAFIGTTEHHRPTGTKTYQKPFLAGIFFSRKLLIDSLTQLWAIFNQVKNVSVIHSSFGRLFKPLNHILSHLATPGNTWSLLVTFCHGWSLFVTFGLSLISAHLTTFGYISRHIWSYQVTLSHKVGTTWVYFGTLNNLFGSNWIYLVLPESQLVTVVSTTNFSIESFKLLVWYQIQVVLQRLESRLLHKVK